MVGKLDNRSQQIENKAMVAVDTKLESLKNTRNTHRAKLEKRIGHLETARESSTEAFEKKMQTIADAHAASLKVCGDDHQADLQLKYNQHRKNLIREEKDAHTDSVARLEEYTATKLDELTNRANKTSGNVTSWATVSEKDLTARRKEHEKFIDLKMSKIQSTMNLTMASRIAEGKSLVDKKISDTIK